MAALRSYSYSLSSVLFCLGCFHVFDSGWVSGRVCDITEVINETPVPTSSLPPPSLSLILFLCHLTALHRFSQCRLCFLLRNPVDLPDFPSSSLPPCLSTLFLVYLLSDLAAPVPVATQKCSVSLLACPWGCVDRTRLHAEGAAKDTSDMVTVVQWKWGTGCYQRCTSASLFCWVSAQWDS